MNYLDAFLGRGEAENRVPSPLTELPKPRSVSSVGALPPLFPGNGMPELPAPALGAREPCAGCGRTDWVVSVVMEYGARLCPRCWTSGGVR